MAKNRIAYYTREGRVESATTLGAGLPIDVFTAGPDGSKIFMITITGETGAPTDAAFYVNGFAVHIQTAPVVNDDLLGLSNAPTGPNTQKYLNIAAGDIVSVSTSVGDTITVAIYGEDY